MRKPNWTEEQCLLLAQLVEEHKGILKGKFGPGVTARGKKQTWELIAQNINASFPWLCAPVKIARNAGTCCNQKPEGKLQHTSGSHHAQVSAIPLFFFLNAGSYLKQLYVNMWSTALFSRGWTTC